MDEALDGLARAIGEPALHQDEIDVLLDLARDVAHATERRLAPLSTFLAGVAVARAAPTATRSQALREIADRLRAATASEEG